MHGYINPCGCSKPQNGGLERRYNFIESLKAKGWDVVGIDLGELPETHGIQEQNMLKYDLSVKALRAMNYRAMGIGKDEVRARRSAEAMGADHLGQEAPVATAHQHDARTDRPRASCMSGLNVATL